MGSFSFTGADGKEHTFEADTPEIADQVIKHLLGQQQTSGKQGERVDIEHPETFIFPDAPSGPIQTPPSLQPGTALQPPPAGPDETKGGTQPAPSGAPPPAPLEHAPWSVAPGVTIPPPSGVGSPPPPDNSLTGGSIPAPRPTYWVLPYPGAPRRVPSRLTQEQWDRQVVVRRLADRLRRRGDSPGLTDVATNSMMFNLLPQFRGLSSTLGEWGRRFQGESRQDLESDLPSSEIYGYYRDAYRQLLSEYERDNPILSLGAGLLGGFGSMGPAGGIRGAIRGLSAPPGAVGALPSTARQLGSASGYGAAGGAVSGAAEDSTSFDTHREGAVHGALGGAALGPVAYLGLRGLISGAHRWRRLRAQRPDGQLTPQQRLAEWQELGVEPPTTALMPPRSRRVAEFFARTPFGVNLRGSTSEGVARLHQSLTDALRFGGGPRNASQAGEEAQALIRRALEAGHTPEQIRRMSLVDLQAISGVESPPLAPGQPQRRGYAPPPVPAEYVPETMEGLVFRRGLTQDLDEALQVQRARASVLPESPQIPPRVHTPVENVPEPPMRTGMADEIAKAQKAIQDIEAELGRYQTQTYFDQAGLDFRQSNLMHARRRLTGLLAQNKRNIAEDRIRAQQAAQAESNRRVDAIYEQVRAQRQHEANQRTERARTEAATAASERVRAGRAGLQSELERINADRMEQALAKAAERKAQTQGTPEEREAGARPTGLPRSKESYRDQIAAGEQALSQMAPRSRVNLLETNSTNLAQELNTIALEARGALRNRGYREGRIIDPETGHFHPEFLTYLAEEVGLGPGGLRAGQLPPAGSPLTPSQRFIRLLQRLADQRRGEFASGVTGVSDIIRDLQILRGERNVNTVMLDRIIQAVERDLVQVASQTPEGRHWLRQRQALDAAKQRIETELAEPLRAVTGTSNPSAALELLQASTRPGGNINTLRAFLQIASDKGDRHSAVSLLLTNLIGDNMQIFTRNWRALTPEARALLFQGSLRDLGTRLERFANAFGGVGDFPTRFHYRELSRVRNIIQLVTAYTHTGETLAAVGGQLLADRAMTSAWFRRWMLRAPLEAGPLSPQWRRHMDLLSGVIASTFTGTNAALGREIEQRLRQLYGMAGPLLELIPEARAEASGPGRSLRSTRQGKGVTQSEQGLVTPPPSQRMTLGKQGTVRDYTLPESQREESVFDRLGVADTDRFGRPVGRPDQGQFLAGQQPRRGRVEDHVGPSIPSTGAQTAAALRPHLPRGAADMLGTVLDYSPFEGAHQGGQMLAHGVENADLGSALMGAVNAWPGNLGIVIGLPGARRLALSGRGNAQVMINLAEQMQARGVPFRQIQEEVSSRLAMLGDNELGTVVRLPSGQIGMEIVSSPERLGSMAPYEIRSLGDVRRDQGALYTALPQIRSTEVWYNPDLGDFGASGYAQGSRIILEREPRRLGAGRVLEHETQHIVSAHEGFPGPATPQAYGPGGDLRHLLPRGMTPRDAYYATADEWLARTSANRMYGTSEMLREYPIQTPRGLITYNPVTGEAIPGAAMNWTAASLRRVAQRVAKGEKVKDIAAELGMKPSALYAALQRSGFFQRSRPRATWTPERTAEINKLLEEGKSIREIAMHFGITYGRMHEVIRDLRRTRLQRVETIGGDVRPPGRVITDEQAQEILRLWKENKTIAEVAELTGLNADGVNSFLRRERVGLRLENRLPGTRPKAQEAGTRETREALVRRLRREGLTWEQVAEKLGISKGGIKGWRSRIEEARQPEKVDGRRRLDTPVLDQRQRLINMEDALREQGKSPAEIAREINLRYREGISADEIRTGDVWWRMAEVE